MTTLYDKRTVDRMKKVDLIEVCKEWNIEYEGKKNDDLRADIMVVMNKENYICRDCVYFKKDVELVEHNIPALPGTIGNVCRYYKCMLAVLPKVCDGFNPGGIGKTADAKINERKRKMYRAADE